MSKANRKPTGEKKSAKKGETTPSKTKRAKKGAPAAAAQHEEPTVAPTPVVETPAPTTDAERLDGRHVLDCLRFALDAAPKAKESPALAFVLVDGDRLVATDDYVHHTAWLLANVATSPVKITRASAEALAAVVAGELKAGEATESAVRLTWNGLIVEIERAGETHQLALERYEAGPAAEFLRLAAPAMRAHVALGAFASELMGWKGGGVVDVFSTEDVRQLWLQASVGETPIARRVLSARGASLGIRQPTLPGVSTTPTPPPAAPAASTDPVPAVPPSGPVPALGSSSTWCEVRVLFDDAWRAVDPAVREQLEPFHFDTDSIEVVWGPYPSTAARLALVERWLRALGCSPRCVAAEAPDLVTAFLETTPVRELDAPARQLGAGDAIDAEVIDAGDDGEVV